MEKKWQIAWIHNGDAGGAKRFAFEMVRTLSSRGHIIDQYSISTSIPNRDYLPLTPFVRASDEIVIWRPDVSWIRPYLLSCFADVIATLWAIVGGRKAYRRLAESINTGPYDFVHIDQFYNCQTLGVVPYLRKPILVYINEASGQRYQQVQHATSFKAWRRWYNNLCLYARGLSEYARSRRDLAAIKSVHLVLTNSHYSREVLYDRCGRLADVCYVGVDTSRFRPGTNPIRPMILSIGRMVRAKQHHLVIEAAGRIPRNLRPQVLVATPECVDRVMEPGYIEDITRLAKDLDVDLRVVYRPKEDELVKFYSEALAVVFIPIMEPFGLVALEAMASGTPVIGVKEAGIRETVLDGNTGLLVERDIGEIARAIVELVQNIERRNQLGRRGADYVREQWTWEHASDRYEKAVRKIFERVPS